MVPKYDNELLNEFVRDMESAGRPVRHYRGRFHWQGPAVEVHDINDYLDVTGQTDVPLQRDHMGKGFIVYPLASGILVGGGKDEE